MESHTFELAKKDHLTLQKLIRNESSQSYELSCDVIKRTIAVKSLLIENTPISADVVEIIYKYTCDLIQISCRINDLLRIEYKDRFIIQLYKSKIDDDIYVYADYIFPNIMACKVHCNTKLPNEYKNYIKLSPETFDSKDMKDYNDSYSEIFDNSISNLLNEYILTRYGVSQYLRTDCPLECTLMNNIFVQDTFNSHTYFRFTPKNHELLTEMIMVIRVFYDVLDHNQS